MTGVSDRLRQAMAEAGLDQAALASKIGVTQGAIGHILQGRTAKSRYLPEIATALSVPVRWLSGESDSRDLEAVATTSQEEVIDDLGLVMVEEVDLAYGMGGGSFSDQPPESKPIAFPRAWLRALTKSLPETLFFARGRGDSMLPTVLDGDIVLIDRGQRTIFEQDAIWAVSYGELGMIKRVRRLPGGTFELNSDNPAVRPIAANDDEMHVIGRVIWIGRKV